MVHMLICAHASNDHIKQVSHCKLKSPPNILDAKRHMYAFEKLICFDHGGLGTICAMNR